MLKKPSFFNYVEAHISIVSDPETRDDSKYNQRKQKINTNAMKATYYTVNTFTDCLEFDLSVELTLESSGL